MWAGTLASVGLQLSEIHICVVICIWGWAAARPGAPAVERGAPTGFICIWGWAAARPGAPAVEELLCHLNLAGR